MTSTQGYLKQQFQNFCSKKTIPLSPILVDEPKTRTNLVLTKYITITGYISMDETGRLPIPFSLESKYFIICYDYDSNTIISISINSREGLKLLRAYKEVNNHLTDRGLKPQIQRLDNEASSNLKKTMTRLQVKYQLVPPHSHRRNPTERPIQT